MATKKKYFKAILEPTETDQVFPILASTIVGDTGKYKDLFVSSLSIDDSGEIYEVMTLWLKPSTRADYISNKSNYETFGVCDFDDYVIFTDKR